MSNKKESEVTIKFTDAERKWLNVLREVLANCPSERLVLADISSAGMRIRPEPSSEEIEEAKSHSDTIGDSTISMAVIGVEGTMLPIPFTFEENKENKENEDNGDLSSQGSTVKDAMQKAIKAAELFARNVTHTEVDGLHTFTSTAGWTISNSDKNVAFSEARNYFLEELKEINGPCECDSCVEDNKADFNDDSFDSDFNDDSLDSDFIEAMTATKH